MNLVLFYLDRFFVHSSGDTMMNLLWWGWVILFNFIFILIFHDDQYYAACLVCMCVRERLCVGGCEFECVSVYFLDLYASVS